MSRYEFISPFLVGLTSSCILYSFPILVSVCILYIVGILCCILGQPNFFPNLRLRSMVRLIVYLLSMNYFPRSSMHSTKDHYLVIHMNWPSSPFMPSNK